MRLVLINELHPDSPHVGAIRFREFAKALRARGHDVVLLTDDLAPPKKNRIDDLPWGLRQIVIAWRFLISGGLRPSWRRRMQPEIDRLATEFKPDLVWATFGSVDCWAIARDLARKTACPWVADLKDFWPHFIPKPFRSVLAWRYRDAAAWTALSRTHAQVARPWFDAAPTVIYSGFPAAAIRAGIEAPEPVICLFGSLYGGTLLPTLLQGMPPKLRLVYRGDDRALVEAMHASGDYEVALDADGFIPTEELLALQGRATANVYLPFGRTFHHKFLELLAARRPILALPADYDEAKEIAAATGIPFFSCRTEQDVANALTAASVRSAVGDPAAIREFSWEAQAEKLEALFGSVLQPRS